MPKITAEKCFRKRKGFFLFEEINNYPPETRKTKANLDMPILSSLAVGGEEQPDSQIRSQPIQKKLEKFRDSRDLGAETGCGTVVS